MSVKPFLIIALILYPPPPPPPLSEFGFVVFLGVIKWEHWPEMD